MTGVGSAVPKTVLTNDDLSRLVETSDAWIASRTGIRERRILSPGETLSDLAVDAGRKALEMAGVDASEVDLVLLATSSPDDAFGSATTVANGLGASKATAFDLTAACSGFVFGLVTAAQFIRAGGARTVLLLGADALSRFVDWSDRGTCILFGDGAGAVLLQAGADGEPCALLGHATRSDGGGHRHLRADLAEGGKTAVAASVGGRGAPQVDGEGDATSTSAGGGTDVEDPRGAAGDPATYSNIAMAGQEVFKFAVRAVPSIIEEALSRAGVEKSDVSWLVMHQANARILQAAAQRIEIDPSRVVSNLARYGNTSAASIPIALDEAVREGGVAPGDLLAMAGFGAGLSWGAAIVRWG